MSINSLHTILSGQADIIAQNKAKLAARLGASAGVQGVVKAVAQEKTVKAQEEIAGSMASQNQQVSLQENSHGGRPQIQNYLKEQNPQGITPPPTKSMFEQIIDRFKALESKPNRITGEFRNFTEYKQDRVSSGLFAKYQEAGEKVAVPYMATAGNAKPSSSQNEVDLRLKEGFERGGINFEEYMGERQRIAEALRDPNYTPHAPGEWTEAEVRDYYGNYFVFKMENYVGEVMGALESIAHHEDSVDKNTKLLGELTNPREKISTERFISEAETEIASKKQKITGTLKEMLNWAEDNGVTEDAKRFFAEFSRDYYGKSLRPNILFTMYNTA